MLAQGATVLLITDGLEREDGGELAREIDRLHKSARRLIWLNPLLRYRASNRGRAASARCCRMSTTCSRCTIFESLAGILLRHSRSCNEFFGIDGNHRATGRVGALFK